MNKIILSAALILVLVSFASATNVFDPLTRGEFNDIVCARLSNFSVNYNQTIVYTGGANVSGCINSSNITCWVDSGGNINMYYNGTRGSGGNSTQDIKNAGFNFTTEILNYLSTIYPLSTSLNNVSATAINLWIRTNVSNHNATDKHGNSTTDIKNAGFNATTELKTYFDGLYFELTDKVFNTSVEIFNVVNNGTFGYCINSSNITCVNGIYSYNGTIGTGTGGNSTNDIWKAISNNTWITTGNSTNDIWKAISNNTWQTMADTSTNLSNYARTTSLPNITGCVNTTNITCFVDSLRRLNISYTGALGTGGNTTSDIWRAIMNGTLAICQNTSNTTCINGVYSFNGSAGTGTTYTAGSNISLTGNVISINMTIPADTNAGTLCAGDTTYLSGEGNCNDLSLVYWDACSDAYSCSWSTFGSSVDDTEMTAEDFGDWSCTGGEDGCTIDAAYWTTNYYSMTDRFSNTNWTTLYYAATDRFTNANWSALYFAQTDRFTNTNWSSLYAGIGYYTTINFSSDYYALTNRFTNTNWTDLYFAQTDRFTSTNWSTLYAARNAYTSTNFSTDYYGITSRFSNTNFTNLAPYTRTNFTSELALANVGNFSNFTANGGTLRNNFNITTHNITSVQCIVFSNGATDCAI